MGKASSFAGIALALGAFTSVFAPSASAESQPDLTVGTLYFKDIDVTEVATIPVVVKNNGDKYAVGPELYIQLGPGLALLEPITVSGWRCSAPLRSNDNETTTACTASSSIEAGQSKTIPVKVHGEPGQAADQFYVTLGVDPNSKIPESNENNNFVTQHF